jgi:hypothetical protein
MLLLSLKTQNSPHLSRTQLDTVESRFALLQCAKMQQGAQGQRTQRVVSALEDGTKVSNTAHKDTNKLRAGFTKGNSHMHTTKTHHAHTHKHISHTLQAE